MIAPLPTFFYAGGVIWAAALSNTDPVIALAPAVGIAALGFLLHTLGHLKGE